jgi:predicted acylesterase/phospholipase RssA
MIRNQPKKKRRTKTAPGSKKTALVVSGGGAKGAFAVGVLKHLFLKYRETGWFSIAGGTSTGALIAPIAAVMAAPDPMGFQAYQTLEKMYTTVCTLDILEKQSVFELIRRQDALYESDPLNDLLHRTFQPEWFAWLQRSKAPDSYVVYTNYQNGRKIFASPKDEGMTRERFIQAMLASASVPVVMEATIIDGDVCYDGGVRDLVPFGKAIALGADTIVPIFLDPEEFSETRSRFRRMDKILLRTLAILVDETGRNDFAMADLINIGIQAKDEILRAFSRDKSAREKIRRILSRKEFRALFGPDKRLIRIIDGLRPDEPLTENSLTFDPAKMSRWTDLGENKARAIFEKSPFVKVKRA